MNQKTGLAVIIMITLGIATVATGAILRQSAEVIGLLCILLGWPYRIAAIESPHIIKRSIILGQFNISGFLFLCRNWDEYHNCG